MRCWLWLRPNFMTLSKRSACLCSEVSFSSSSGLSREERRSESADTPPSEGCRRPAMSIPVMWTAQKTEIFFIYYNFVITNADMFLMLKFRSVYLLVNLGYFKVGNFTNLTINLKFYTIKRSSIILLLLLNFYYYIFACSLTWK